MKKLSLSSLAIACAALLTACGGGSDGGSSTPVVGKNGTVAVASASVPASYNCGVGNMPQALVAALNAARAQARSCGGTAMPASAGFAYWNTYLADAAYRHSADRAAVAGSGHIDTDGSTQIQRAAAAGYSGGVNEVFYWATGSLTKSGVVVNGAVDWWLNSPDHCKAIMQAAYVEVGAACVKNGDRISFTAVLGTGG